MDGLVNGLSGASHGHGGAGDAAPRAVNRAGAAPGEGGRQEIARPTWAEEKQEERPERAEDGRRQHGHCPPTSTQRRNLGETGETKGGGWQDRRPHQQTLKCKRSQQNSEEWNRYKRPPSEQEYSEDVSQLRHGLNVKPTREELNHLSKACCRLWELDLNRLLPGKDYRIECGQGKKVYQKGDMASENLFSWLKDDILHRPTYSRFCALLDNYNPRQGYKELVTQQDKNEEAAFIEEIARSAPIKYLHQYLVLKGITSQDQKDFKKMLASLWFDLYGRGGCSGSSSAFEHVFVGEIKGRCRGENEVTGFHNWIQAGYLYCFSGIFYLEESKGNVDYQGYIFPRTCGDLPDSEMQLLTIQFEWHGLLKSVSSTLVGVSPEFEIALYTLCFFAGEENNHVHVGPYALNIKCYRMGVNKIGSAFPVAEQ
ncbi:poly(U)-specific endoribonuclease-B [Hordeum vulgare]|nr:poly(U)-specific endoribonuclease-B [Hordeum vulgare]